MLAQTVIGEMVCCGLAPPVGFRNVTCIKAEIEESRAREQG
jgi:hypothetical protein